MVILKQQNNKHCNTTSAEKISSLWQKSLQLGGFMKANILGLLVAVLVSPAQPAFAVNEGVKDGVNLRIDTLRTMWRTPQFEADIPLSSHWTLGPKIKYGSPWTSAIHDSNIHGGSIGLRANWFPIQSRNDKHSVYVGHSLDYSHYWVPTSHTYNWYGNEPAQAYSPGSASWYSSDLLFGYQLRLGDRFNFGFATGYSFNLSSNNGYRGPHRDEFDEMIRGQVTGEATVGWYF
jgi:hypothetical protein